MHTKVGGKSVIKECQIDNADVYIELLEAGDDVSVHDTWSFHIC